MNGLCWATHPEQPNLSPNARGRVLHIEAYKGHAMAFGNKKGEKFTFCGMQVTRIVDDREARYRDTCRNCWTLYNRFLEDLWKRAQSQEASI